MNLFRLVSRILAVVSMATSIFTMTLVLGWASENYHWHIAVAPSIALAYAVIVVATMKPRAAKKVVKK